MAEETYEVSINVPEGMELTAEERAALKESFRARAVEALRARGDNRDVDAEIITGGGGGGNG